MIDTFKVFMDHLGSNLPFIVVLGFGYLGYLIYALRVYVSILKDVIQYNKSQGCAISFQYGWREVKINGIPIKENKPSCEPEKEKDRRIPSPLDQFSIVPFLPLKIGKLYFSFTNLSLTINNLSFRIILFIGTKKSDSLFCSLPIIKILPGRIQIVLFFIVQFISIFVLSKLIYYFGYVFRLIGHVTVTVRVE